MSGQWIVVCEDGRQRHDGLFESLYDAWRWAEWGHACTNNHRIVDPDVTEADITRRWMP